jgi:hypothetical protein
MMPMPTLLVTLGDDGFARRQIHSGQSSAGQIEHLLGVGIGIGIGIGAVAVAAAAAAFV